LLAFLKIRRGFGIYEWRCESCGDAEGREEVGEKSGVRNGRIKWFENGIGIHETSFNLKDYQTNLKKKVTGGSVKRIWSLPELENLLGRYHIVTTKCLDP
jgi:hypothetical protein